MELIVNEMQELKPIDFNYEDIKKELTEKLKQYDMMIYSEDNIKEAKEDRANLNKLAKALDDKRKEVKNQFMVPYMAFEEKLKELVGLVENTSKKIDGQVKTFEDKAKQEKMDMIKAIYKGCIGDLEQLISFEKLFKQKWLNVSEKINKIETEMVEEVERIRQEYETLKTVITGSEFEEQLKMFFFSILSLERTLAQKQILEEQKAKLKAMEENKKQETKQEPETIKQETKQDKLYEVKFKLIATEGQLNLLKRFLVENNIKLERLEN